MASAKGKTTSATTNAGTPHAINVFTVNNDKSPATWPVPAGRLGTQPGRLGNAWTVVCRCGFVVLCKGLVGGAKPCASAASSASRSISLTGWRAGSLSCNRGRSFAFLLARTRNWCWRLSLGSFVAPAAARACLKVPPKSAAKPVRVEASQATPSKAGRWTICGLSGEASRDYGRSGSLQ